MVCLQGTFRPESQASVHLGSNQNSCGLEQLQLEAIPCNRPPTDVEARVLFGDVTISGITSRNLYFDVLGLIKVYDAREKTVAVLLDDTMKMVSIGVWDDAGKQDGLVQQIAKLEGQVVVITGVKSQYWDGSLNLNTSKSSVILQQDDSGLDETKLQKLGEGGL